LPLEFTTFKNLIPKLKAQLGADLVGGDYTKEGNLVTLGTNLNIWTGKIGGALGN